MLADEAFRTQLHTGCVGNVGLLEEVLPHLYGEALDRNLERGGRDALIAHYLLPPSVDVDWRAAAKSVAQLWDAECQQEVGDER